MIIKLLCLGLNAGKTFFFVNSNFIPMKSEKFEFQDLDTIIRLVVKNESENRKNEVT